MSRAPGQKIAEPDHDPGTHPSKDSGTKRLGWLVVPVLLSVLLGGATAVGSIQQSLWIDELHTAWVTTGPWQQLVPRAAVGNQTPIYFAWLWWLGRTFGYSEICLRATSLVAWWGCLGLLAVALNPIIDRSTHHKRRHLSLWGLLCLVALDRQQMFFATEARPYMLMSLVVMLGWLMLNVWLATEAHSRRGRLAWLSWISCCVMAMWLQPTAVLFVAAQLFFALVFVAIGRGGSTRLADWLLACVVIAGLAWPMRYVLEPAWQGRHAWTAFAADLRFGNVLRQFPIVVVAVPGVIAAVLHWSRPAFPGQRVNYAPMWFCGWALPWLSVILLTVLGIAPLMHARYLFAATLPLTLWTACMLGRLANGRFVGVIVFGMILLQAVQQGSVAAWLSGNLPVVERGEKWREAVAHINQMAANQPGKSQIYCAASLIEGGRAGFVDGSALRENYLSLPVRTLYPVTDRIQIVSLLNDPRTWPDAISRHAEDASTRWLLLRTSKAGLTKRLQLSGLRPLELLDFGAVQLVRF